MAVPNDFMAKAIERMKGKIGSPSIDSRLFSSALVARNEESLRAMPKSFITSTPSGKEIDLAELRAFSASRETTAADAFSALIRAEHSSGYSMSSKYTPKPSARSMADFFTEGEYVSYEKPNEAEKPSKHRQSAKTDIPQTKIESDWI